MFLDDELSYEDYIERQELDRKRIADELHDTSLQNLTHIIHQIELASLYIDTDTTRAKLELNHVNKQLRSISMDIRNTIFNLRPMSFDDLGFEDTIRQFVSFSEKKSDVKVSLDKIENISDYFNKNQLIEIYRIIQECINNSLKHSKGTIVTLSIYKNKDYVMIDICDDGVGISSYDINKLNHYGFHILKERVLRLGGKLQIENFKRNPLTSIKNDKIGMCTEIDILVEIEKD